MADDLSKLTDLELSELWFSDDLKNHTTQVHNALVREVERRGLRLMLCAMGAGEGDFTTR